MPGAFGRRALLLLLMPPLTAVAQAIDPEAIRFRHHSVEDGLSQSTINCIIQDHEGFLWLGTQDGLNRYDGYTFKTYRHDARDSLSLSDNYINCLYEDSRGSLWIGTYNGGLNRYDREQNGFVHYHHDTSSNGNLSGVNVWSITEDRSANLWVAVWGGGLNRFDREQGTWSQLRHSAHNSSSLVDDRVTSVLADRSGLLWIGTWNGLDRFDPVKQTYHHFRTDPHNAASLTGNRIVSICEDEDGDLWFGVLDAGLNRLDRRGEGFVRYLHSGRKQGGLTSNRVGRMIVDDRGILWIATQDEGIMLLDKRSGFVSGFRHHTGDPSSLSSDAIMSLYQDRSGGVWVGTDGAGANHYDPSRFKFNHLRHEPGNLNSLANPIIRAILEDRSGKLWIGMMGGNLDCFDPVARTYTHYHDVLQNHGLSSSITILALAEDRDRNLWVGTDGGGLFELDKRRREIRQLRHDARNPRSLNDDYIMTLCESRDGALWFGTQGGGLGKLNRQTHACERFLRTGPGDDQLSGNYVWAILEDDDGSLWCGTWGAGISIMNPKTHLFHSYLHDPSDARSLCHNTVLVIQKDSRGRIWVGTLGGGLDLFNRETGTFVHFTEADGLPNNVVSGILEDSTGNLWLSTNRGIACFDPVSKAFRTYTISDGLQSPEYNQGAFCRGYSGRLYFGGINGLNSCYPERIPFNARIPPVYITSFRVFDREIGLTHARERAQLLELSYSENYFSFEFASLDYAAPEKNSYRYRMKGFDHDWVESGSRRYASYTNLDPGDYVFQVQGSNNDGVWNTTGASIGLRIAPPLWRTSWFRLVSLAILVGVIYWLYHRRVSRLKHEKTIQSEFSMKLNASQENERKRIAGELHDSLGQELLTVRNTLARMAECERVTPDALAQLGASVQQAIDEVRGISADLHPHMLERLGLTKTIDSTVRRCAQSASLEINTQIDTIDNLYDTLGEISIYRIIQEALNNIVKHSHASESSITVHRAADYCVIVISDDGCGFEAPENPRNSTRTGGLGLVNMAERVRMLRGDMEIRTSPGHGTTLRFRFPFNQAGDTT